MNSFLYFFDSDSLEKNDNVNFSENARKILEKRYLLKDSNGDVTETPEQMFDRVSLVMAEPDSTYVDQEKSQIQFYNLLSSKKFFPNSPTFTGAGTGLGQLAACFVLPVADDLGKQSDGIFATLTVAALIQQSGGGNGFSFSKLRSKGTRVSKSNGVATGPIGFMQVYDAAFGVIAQGGVRRGANMGVLRVDHPDIREFVTCKSEEGKMANFNLSVAMTDPFMNAVKNDTTYDLIDPHSEEVKESPRAREIFDLIVKYAYKNGEPGVLFVDTANKFNPVPHLYALEATNPCGEQWLGPYENCCLGSINLNEHITEDGKMDWEEFRKTIVLSARFLDNVVTQNKYIPSVPQIKESAMKARRIGLGIMGLADAMYALKIRYGSEEGQDYAAKISEFLRFHSMKASIELAKERGPFPAIKGSIYDPDNLVWEAPHPVRPYKHTFGAPNLEWSEIENGIRFYGIRNAATTTVAPTGTISTVAGIEGYGCEPVFALAYYRNVYQAAGDEEKLTLTYVSPTFQKALDECSLSDETKKKIIEEVINTGTCQNIEELPHQIKNTFVVSSDISGDQHIEMQAAIQAFIDNSISKTCNLPADATEQDVKDIYMKGWELGCKGLTVYVSGSREEVVLETNETKKKDDTQKISVASDAEVRPKSVVSQLDRDYKLAGTTYKVATPQGKAFITVNKTSSGRPFEIFINVGKAGSDVGALAEGLGRLASGWLRVPNSSQETIKEIVKQLTGIGGSKTVGFGKNKVASIPDAVAKVLAEEFDLTISSSDDSYHSGNANGHTVTDKSEQKSEESLAFAHTDMCPECGNYTLVKEEGCCKCYSCGYSEC